MDKYLNDFRNGLSIFLVFMAGILPLTGQNELTLFVDDVQAECGDVIVVPVRVLDFDQVVALDFSMVWNPNSLKFAGPPIGNLNGTLGLNAANFGPYQPTLDNDTLTFQWFNASGKSLPDSAILFSLTFTVKGDGGLLGNLDFSNMYTAIACGKILNGSIEEVGVDTLNADIIISDNTDPVLVCPSDTSVVTSPGLPSVVVEGIDPDASDNCAIQFLNYTLTGATNGSGQGTASGVNFLSGTTTVNYSAEDYAGHLVDCSFTVEVTDTILRLFAIAGIASCDDTAFTVNVTTQNFNALASLQFGMAWDPTQIQFLSLGNFHPLLNLSNSNFGPSGGINDTLTFSWFNPAGVSIPDDSILFSLTFSILGGSGTNTTIFFDDMPALPIQAAVAVPPPGFPIVIGVQTFLGIIAIVDTVPPTVNCPDDLTVTIPQTSMTAQINMIDPTAADNCVLSDTTWIKTGSTIDADNGSASGTFFNPGITDVRYIVQDQGGNTDTCQFRVTVLEDTLQIIVDAPDAYCTDTTVVVCIRTTGFNNLASLQFAFHWDNAILQLDSLFNYNPALGLSSGNFGPVILYDTLTFSWFNPGGITLPDDDALFCLHFTIVGGLNAMSDLTLMDYPSLPIQASVAQPAPNFPVVVPVELIHDKFQIIDNIPPVIIDCPQDIVLPNEPGLCSAVANWTDPTGLDDCDPDVEVSCDFPSGTTFPVGTTTVICVAIDDAGLTDTCTFTVTVLDVEKPVLSCPNDLIVESDPDTCGTFVSWLLPDASDNCDLDISISGPANQGFLPVGETVLTYVGTDDAGNTDTCQYSIFVIDLTPPFFTNCPGDLTVNATTDSCTAIIDLPVPIAGDNCGVIADLSYRIGDSPVYYPSTEAFDIEFPKGTTTITWYAFDNLANVDSCVYQVTVDGGGDIVIFCSTSIETFSAADSCGATVSWDAPSFTGGCGNTDNWILVADAPSGSFFPVGNQVVTIYLIDPDGPDTLGSCSFDVNVLDVTPPVFDCLGNVNLVADPDSCGISFFWDPPLAIDNCSDSLIYTADGPDPGFFPNGVYTVTYTATDASGNSSVCEIILSVCDNVPPVITGCPSDTVIVLEPDLAICTATIGWDDPVFTDNCTSEVTVVQVGQPGNFPTGPHTITYTGLDDCGNSSVCSFTITVLDQFAPSADCPEDVTVSATDGILTDPSGFVDSLVLDDCLQPMIYYRGLGGTDNCSGVTSSLISPAWAVSGASFPVGTHTLVFGVYDASGNADTCEVDITVLPYVIGVNANKTVLCEGDSLQLTAESVANASYSWTGPNGFTSNLQNPSIPVVTVDHEGNYLVTVSIPYCPDLTGSIDIFILDYPVILPDSFFIFDDEVIDNGNLISNDVINFGANANITFLTQPSSGTLINNFDGTFDYTPAPGFIGTVEFIYEVCYEECPDYCDQAVVKITIEPRDDSCKPNNMITPNNDARNDVVVIDCIMYGKYPNNGLKIYNQWGDLVYQASPYANNWDGTYQGNPAQPLPDGTYYYVFTRGDGSDPVTGFITILR